MLVSAADELLLSSVTMGSIVRSVAESMAHDSSVHASGADQRAQV